MASKVKRARTGPKGSQGRAGRKGRPDKKAMQAQPGRGAIPAHRVLGDFLVRKGPRGR